MRTLVEEENPGVGVIPYPWKGLGVAALEFDEARVWARSTSFKSDRMIQPSGTHNFFGSLRRTRAWHQAYSCTFYFQRRPTQRQAILATYKYVQN